MRRVSRTEAKRRLVARDQALSIKAIDYTAIPLGMDGRWHMKSVIRLAKSARTYPLGPTSQKSRIISS